MSDELRPVPQICQSCGRVSPGGMALAPGASVTLKNFTMISVCPYCGGRAITTDGSYRWGDMLWEAVRQPGVTREAIEKFREVAEALRSGESSAENATAQIAQINSTFGKILTFANTNAGALGVLIGILTLLATFYSIICSNEISAQTHVDAQSLLKASQQETEALRSSEQVARTSLEVIAKLGVEIERLNVLSEQSITQMPPILRKITKSQAQRPERGRAGNRHERRKAARLAKRQPPE